MIPPSDKSKTSMIEKCRHIFYVKHLLYMIKTTECSYILFQITFKYENIYKHVIEVRKKLEEFKLLI